MIAETETYRPIKPGFFQALVKFREAGIILIIVLLSALVGLRNPVFLTIDNFRDIMLNISSDIRSFESRRAGFPASLTIVAAVIHRLIFDLAIADCHTISP